MTMRGLVIAIVMMSASAAQAGGITSVYSTFNTDQCKATLSQEPDGGGTWVCKGIKGFDVTYWEGDLRGTMSFGPKAGESCASMQTFSGFNGPGKTIEWRMDSGRPFATILRWSVSNGIDDSKINWLVITKIDGKNTCRTALVDSQLPQANEVARERASSTRNFKCEKDNPEIVSRRELKTEDYLTGVPCGKGPFREGN